jgi:hypothetical protein
MAIVINGSGTVTGLSVGGLPDGTVDSGTIATGTIVDADVANVAASKLTGALPAISGANLTNLPSKGKNLIINGAMRVQQRGTASVTSGYFVDRFQLSGCSASAVLTSSTPTEFPTAISVSATSGNPIVIQKIESENCQHLSGQTVTASFYAKNISNATTLYAKLSYAGSADSWGSSTTISEQNLGALSGSWVKYTASWTVPSGGLNGLSLNILCAGTSTFTMGVTGVQLEVGSTATDFEHRSYGEELALCQRYFINIHTNIPFAGFANNANTQFGVALPVPLRGSPTASISAGNKTTWRHNGSQNSTATAVTTASWGADRNIIGLQVAGFSSNTDGNAVNFGTGQGVLSLDSEL